MLMFKKLFQFINRIFGKSTMEVDKEALNEMCKVDNPEHTIELKDPIETCLSTALSAPTVEINAAIPVVKLELSSEDPVIPVCGEVCAETCDIPCEVKEIKEAKPKKVKKAEKPVDNTEAKPKVKRQYKKKPKVVNK